MMTRDELVKALQGILEQFGGVARTVPVSEIREELDAPTQAILDAFGEFMDGMTTRKTYIRDITPKLAPAPDEIDDCYHGEVKPPEEWR